MLPTWRQSPILKAYSETRLLSEQHTHLCPSQYTQKRNSEARWTLAGLCSDFARLLGTDVTLALTLSECQRSGWTLLHTLSSRQDLAPGSAPYHGYLCPARKTVEHLWFSTQGQALLGTQSVVLQGWEHDRLFILNINPTEEKTRS